MMLLADQPCDMRCEARPLMMGVDMEVPDQSAQPEALGEPSGKVDEIYRPRTASGQPLESSCPWMSPPKVATPESSVGMLAALEKTDGVYWLFTAVTLNVDS